MVIVADKSAPSKILPCKKHSDPNNFHQSVNLNHGQGDFDIT
ncbi:hypothetical protein Pan161_46900 [Gimesia algae]|uniref:Uncharacterized protein n=1 Tax=Gimesia algae TaxID=2527971 RepID=A0A517VJ37_9PLAN|nr:hypothetical protein Pan161_46900 [Gimesia algae]